MFSTANEWALAVVLAVCIVHSTGGQPLTKNNTGTPPTGVRPDPRPAPPTIVPVELGVCDCAMSVFNSTYPNSGPASPACTLSPSKIFANTSNFVPGRMEYVTFNNTRAYNNPNYFQFNITSYTVTLPAAPTSKDFGVVYWGFADSVAAAMECAMLQYKGGVCSSWYTDGAALEATGTSNPITVKGAAWPNYPFITLAQAAKLPQPSFIFYSVSMSSVPLSTYEINPLIAVFAQPPGPAPPPAPAAAHAVKPWSAWLLIAASTVMAAAMLKSTV